MFVHIQTISPKTMATSNSGRIISIFIFYAVEIIEFFGITDAIDNLDSIDNLETSPLLRGQDQTRKMFEAAVIGAFSIRREAAGGQLPLSEVIGEAITTDAFFRTAFVGAVAPGQVRFFLTVHISSSILIKGG